VANELLSVASRACCLQPRAGNSVAQHRHIRIQPKTSGEWQGSRPIARFRPNNLARPLTGIIRVRQVRCGTSPLRVTRHGIRDMERSRRRRIPRYRPGTLAAMSPKAGSTDCGSVSARPVLNAQFGYATFRQIAVARGFWQFQMPGARHCLPALPDGLLEGRLDVRISNGTVHRRRRAASNGRTLRSSGTASVAVGHCRSVTR
jgi:hypothetical protein